MFILEIAGYVLLFSGVVVLIIYLVDARRHPMCPICGDNKNTERRDGLGYCLVHRFTFKKKKKEKVSDVY
mgnify:CR=1 FL=1